ncbi:MULTISPECIES: hypothetical protein [unclassified Microcoleus]|uniref:hypothetical protein n=1 Tax=unclassified Microcoleus TaxID=2642155 RepID=UPI002FD5E2FB
MVNESSQPRITSKETGFLAASVSPSKILAQKPGFWPMSNSLDAMVNESSQPRITSKETGFLAESVGPSKILAQKPGFWPPVRNS